MITTISSLSNDSDPIFIVGYMHSGTTLLQNILGLNKSVYMGRGETRFFELLPQMRNHYPDLADDRQLRQYIQHLVKKIDRNCDLNDIELQALVHQARSHQDYTEIFCVAFDFLAARMEKSRWVEKTPTHIFFVDDIMKAIPNARVLEIRRDVRDVLASKKTRRQTVWTERYAPEIRGFKNLEKAYDPFWDTLSWKSAIRAGMLAKEEYPGHVLSVRYEDLVTFPCDIVEKICDFLDLEFDSGMLEVTSRNAAEWKQVPTKEGIRSDSVGRWKHILNSGEIALSQAMAKRELEALEVELSSTALTHRLFAVSLVLKSIPNLIDRLYKRWRMGGIHFLGHVIKGYIKRAMTMIRI